MQRVKDRRHRTKASSPGVIGVGNQSVSTPARHAGRNRSGPRSMVWVLVVIVMIGNYACLYEAPRTKFTFVNETDSLLCFNRTSEAAATGDSCAELPAHKTTVWRPGCGELGMQPVVLTVGRGGPEIYKTTALCDEWEESGARIVIEQRGDEYVVIDGLSESTPEQ